MEDKEMLKGTLCVFLLTTVNVHVPFKAIDTLMKKKLGKERSMNFISVLFFHPITLSSM